MKPRYLFAGALLIAPVLLAIVDPVYVHDGMGTGNDYIEMPENQRRSYAMGVINGIMIAPIFGAPREEMKWFESYVEGMTNHQVAAILTKFLEDNPGERHHGLHTLTYRAIRQAFDKAAPKRE